MISKWAISHIVFAWRFFNVISDALTSNVFLKLVTNKFYILFMYHFTWTNVSTQPLPIQSLGCGEGELGCLYIFFGLGTAGTLRSSNDLILSYSLDITHPIPACGYRSARWACY